MATTMLPPAFGGIVGVPSTKGPQIVRALGPSFDIREANSNNFLISGTTKDSTGTALGNCDVHLFSTVDDLEVQQSVSDVNGAYAFYVHSNVQHYIVAYKIGSPDLAGTTVDTLLGSLAGSGTANPVIDDSFSETTYDSGADITFDGTVHAAGQTFTSNGGILSSAKFYLHKAASPTGNAVAKLYALTGTPGTDALPTGTVLATSDTFDVSTLTGSKALITLTFTGANQYEMHPSTSYGIAFEYTLSTGTNQVLIGGDFGLGDNGNAFYSDNSDVWHLPGFGIDVIFYVYRT